MNEVIINIEKTHGESYGLVKDHLQLGKFIFNIDLENIDMSEIVYYLKDLSIDSLIQTSNLNMSYFSVAEGELGTEISPSIMIQDIIPLSYFTFESTIPKVNKLSREFDNYPIGMSDNEKVQEKFQNTFRENLNYYQTYKGYPVSNLPNTILLFRNKDQVSYKLSEYEKLPNNTEKDIKIEFKGSEQILSDMKSGLGSLGTYQDIENIKNRLNF